MERRSGFEVTPFFGAEWWSGAGRTFWSGVGKGANSKINGAYPSLVSADSLYELRRPSDCVFHLEGNPDWRGLPIAMYVYSYRTQSWRRRRGFFSPLRENFLKLVSYDSRNLCARFFTLAEYMYTLSWKVISSSLDVSMHYS